MSVIQKINVDKDVSTKKKTFMQLCKKWDRRIAPAFGVLAFCTLIGIVLYNVIYAESTNCETKKIDYTDHNIMFTKNFDSTCFETKCVVNCSDIIDNGEGLLAGHIKNAISKNANCVDIKLLKLYSCDFQNKTLKNGWLKNVSNNIKKLTIYGGNLEEIEENALASDPFDYLEELILIELEMKILKKKYFLGLDFVTSFEFRLYKSIGPLHVEENALAGLKSLQSISYSQVKLDDNGLSNSFGCTGAKLNNLKILDLRQGIVEKLTDCSFTNIPNIELIYLSNVYLESIDKNSLKMNSKIRHLDLTQNNLTTLENGTFNRINNSDSVKIRLGKNSWYCNCSLQWLKDDFLQKLYIDRTLPPLCNNTINFIDIDFCSDTSSTKQITTSSSTRLPLTTPPEPARLTIDCSLHNQTPISLSEKVILTHSVSVTVNETCIVHLEFLEYSTDPLKVQVFSNVSLEDYALVWFDSNNKNNFGCETPLYNSIILENLKQDTTYSFSVLETCDEKISPKCTFGLKTIAEWNNRSWISNKYRIIVISALISVIIFIIILTIVGTFFFIRRYPTLITGNKSVIVVKSKKDSQDIELPKNFEKPVYWDPYLKPISQGYLTPKFHKYDKVKYRPSLMRSVSEWSLTNNSASYDDPRQIYRMRILHSRLQERNGILRSPFSDFRPPLPPPNGRPQVHLAADFDEESLYNSV